MSDHPIIFSGSMVRSILEDRKTQTRRIAKFVPTKTEKGLDIFASSLSVGDYCTGNPESGKVLYSMRGSCWNTVTERLYCPYGKPGDRLWVRETLQSGARNNPAPRFNHLWRYAADNGVVAVAKEAETAMRIWAHHKEQDYCPSIHMPRWASRITLEIVKARVERVQEISEEDALAEGCTAIPWQQWYEGKKPMVDGSRVRQQYRGVPPADWTEVEALQSNHDPLAHTAKEDFTNLWNSINAKREGGKYSWQSNPWTWVLEFKKSEQRPGDGAPSPARS